MFGAEITTGMSVERRDTSSDVSADVSAVVGPRQLVGIILLSDGTAEQLSALGAVLLSEMADVLADRFRQMIIEQIPHCPSNFRFFTPQRWPVSLLQEPSLQMSTLMSAEGSVYIQQTHETPKIGVKAKTGVALGFVYTDVGASLTDFRSLINNEVSFFSGIPDTYQFLDTNGWPISKHLESGINVGETVVNSCIIVCTDLLVKTEAAGDEVDSGRSVTPNPEPPRKRLKGLKQLSFRSCKDIVRQKNSVTSVTPVNRVNFINEAATAIGNSSGCGGGNDHGIVLRSKKQLLISYVRAEAADYALHLKMKLAEKGYSVYLDVHEISVGVDWQDSLNFAVSNCEVFIPLVTPRYGETLWTNREVKLADVLGKFILPVNFLPDWPPRCLAIQFATTQFVVSGHPHTQRKAVANGVEAGCDSSGGAASWTDVDIQATAMEISQRLKSLHKTAATSLSIPSLVRMKTLRKTFVGKLPAVKSFPSDPEGDIPPQNNNNKPLIVVCLHPQQNRFGHEIKHWLERKSYTVWLSSETDFPIDESDSLSSSQQQSQGETLPVLKEEGSGAAEQIAPFQSVADRAAVVIVLLAQDFALSRNCKQQLFYCEQRKPLVPVHCEDFAMPGWLSMLLGSQSVEISSIKEDNYKQTLLSRLQRVVHSASRNNLEQLSNEAKLNHSVDYIRKTVQTDSCVYIAGSTTFNNPKSEEICKAIGAHLARLEGLSIATGGFYGVGETVSRAYHEEAQYMCKRQNVWHILPDRDAKDWTKQGNQNPDGTFAVAPFGKTLFCGDSVRQRESIIGRCFEICILIEGGPGAAHEAEEFVWNDRTVIPLSCTGGAASGKFSVSQKMFEIPRGVNSQDWQALTSSDLTPDQVAACVARIVSSLLHPLSTSQLPSPVHSPMSPVLAPTTPPPLANVSPPTPPPRTKTALNKMKTVILG